MTQTLKLKTFPATRYIPLGCYAEGVSSVVFLRDGETCRYRDVLLYVRDEEQDGKHQTVVRDKAGQFWPSDSTDVVIEFEPRGVATPEIIMPDANARWPSTDDAGDDFNPNAADEPIDGDLLNE